MPAGIEAQCTNARAIIGDALAGAGAPRNDVVRVRGALTDPADLPAC